MKVAVVGGTGTLGVPLVVALAERGDEVLALSRRPGERLPDGVTHRRVDLADGEGLADALAGAEVVVDASNAPPSEGKALVEGAQRLLAAEAEAGVGHHVGISIVGCDRTPMSYYRAKVEQEEAVAASGIEWSVLRATQFHQLLDWAFGRAARYGVSPTGHAWLQPIDPALVAARLADAVHAGPGGRLPEIAGPRAQTLTELARAWRRAKGRRLLPLRIPMAGGLGRALREGNLCNEAAAAGGPDFEEWLARG